MLKILKTWNFVYFLQFLGTKFQFFFNLLAHNSENSTVCNFLVQNSKNCYFLAQNVTDLDISRFLIYCDLMISLPTILNIPDFLQFYNVRGGGLVKVRFFCFDVL